MTRKVDIGEPPAPVGEPLEQGKPHQFCLTAAMALIAGASSGSGRFLPLMARKPGGRAPAGLLIQAAVCLLLIVVFKLDAIASIGTAVAVLIFMLVTVAHFRVRAEPGARTAKLALAIAASARSTLLAILVISALLDLGWKHFHAGRTRKVQLAHEI